MNRRVDRRGSAGLQLAALVDLLFVITFLLIWEREITLRAKVGVHQAGRQAAEANQRKAEQAAQRALEALRQAEEARKAALSGQKQVDGAVVEVLEKQLADSQQREHKLEEDLRTVYRSMLGGMRQRTQIRPDAPGVASPQPLQSPQPPPLPRR